RQRSGEEHDDPHRVRACAAAEREDTISGRRRDAPRLPQASSAGAVPVAGGASSLRGYDRKGESGAWSVYVPQQARTDRGGYESRIYAISAAEGADQPGRWDAVGRGAADARDRARADGAAEAADAG